MPNTYLTKTFSGGSDSNRNFTISLWFKCSSHDRADDENIYLNYYDGSNRFGIGIDGTDKLKIENMAGGAYTMRLITNRLFRDTNAWYHLVCRAETNALAQEDRFKIYINGVQETSFSTATYIGQNNPINMPNSSYPTTIGAWSGGSQSWNGSMSHFHICDGYSYDASAFGSTDATTGEWKINTSPSVTYGTNGFFILKDGNSVTDQSPNTNNFTVGGGTLTKTEDNPSNNFATGNPLFVQLGTWSNGNNSIVGSTSLNVRPQMWSSLGAKTGKFYAEAKYTDKTGGMVGVSDFTATNAIVNSGTYQGGATGSVGFWNDGSKYVNDSSASYGSAWNNNDIIQIALDLDNSCVYFGINGTWQDSGDPTSGSNKTGGITLTNTRDEDWFMSWGDGSQGNSATCQVNYGNGYFGTTAVATNSGNGYAGAEGSSIFNYQPPTGYTALSTKGLNL